ncbi:MAG: class I SAM-dependent methyltransferase [bacterium]|nr:class I SAM-dependent methyltransferase [bacterium]
MFLSNRSVGGQFREPTGFFGRLFARRMNKRNKPLYQAAFRQMDIRPHDLILEVGFGNGLSLQWLSGLASGGKVFGIDISLTMMKEAERICRSLIRAGKIEILQANSGSIPYPDDFFDKICTINTIYFWDDPDKTANELRRVLKPSGRVFLSFRSKSHLQKYKHTRYHFRFYEPEEVEKLLARNGFRDIRYIEENGKDGHFFSFAALK